MAPLFGRVGGVFLAILLPFLDLGIVQSPMLHPEPTTLSKLLPGYGGSRVLLDGALTRGFDETVPLLIGLAWLAALTIGVALTYRHVTAPARRESHQPTVPVGSAPPTRASGSPSGSESVRVTPGRTASDGRHIRPAGP